MIKPAIKRRAEEYLMANGHSPFREWLIAIKDARARAKITKAVTQMEAGNFGDHKSIADGHGLQERRFDDRPGYRIYFIIEGDQVIIVFGGSNKSDQRSGIASAKRYLADYKARQPKLVKKTHVKKPK